MNYLRKLWNRFLYHTKLVHKYICFLLFLMLAEFLLTHVLLRPYMMQLVINKSQEASEQFLESYVNNIAYRFADYEELLEAFAGDETLRERFSHEMLSDADYSVLDRRIRSILKDQFPYGFYDMAFYPMNRCRSGKTYMIREKEDLSETFRTKLENQEFHRYFVHNNEPYRTKLVSVLYPIYDPDGREVVCVIRLSVWPRNVFRTNKGMSEEYAGKIFVVNAKGEYVYGAQTPDMEEYLEYAGQYIDKWYTRFRIAPFDGSAGRYLTSMYSAKGLRAVYYDSFEEFYAEVKLLNRVLSAGLLGLVFLTFGLGMALSLHIQRRFDHVIEKVDAVAKGDLEVADAVYASDEIGIFDSSFTEMVHRTRQLIETNYISEMKKKDAQLLALQAQIQPHFLFNSLEIINSLVEIGEYDTACEVNARLSSLLRYSINHNSSGIVTLREELDYMRDYLYIQNLRFQNRYRLYEEIEEECLDLPMMKLILQPLVENCIKHGFKNAAAGNIRLQVCKIDQSIKIELRDDGNGMEENAFRNLMEKLQGNPLGDFGEQNDSIGILNIHNRLRLKYGERYQIFIETAPGQGMGTVLILPESEHDEDLQKNEYEVKK